MAAGRGNPCLLEWLDILVGEMSESEVPLLLEAVKDNQEEFIRQHVIRELLQRGGEELADEVHLRRHLNSQILRTFFVGKFQSSTYALCQLRDRAPPALMIESADTNNAFCPVFF